MRGSRRTTLTASARQPVHDLNQLAMRGAGRVAELVDGMLVRQPAQPQQFADPLSPVQLQLGWPAGEQEPRDFAGAEELAEFHRRHVDQEQYEYP